MLKLPNAELDKFLERVGSIDSVGNPRSELFAATVTLAADLVEAEFCCIAEKDSGGLVSLASHPQEWTDSDGLFSPASLPSVIASRGVSYLVGDRGDTRGARSTTSDPKATSVTYKSLVVVPIGTERVLIAGRQDAFAFTEQDLECLRLISHVALTMEHLTDSSPDSDTSQERVETAAAHLSHDAKNFLTIIQGRVEVAREEMQSEHLDAIERASRRLSELIEDTRTLLETGTDIADHEPVQLHEVVQEAWELETTDQATIVTSPLDKIIAERSRLAQLFENLFRNAIEHAGPDVTVWVGMLSDTEGFYIEDDGPGIDESERDSVFDFAYGDSDGSGLGLNIVQWIAATHGWDISIERGEMGGTRFEITGVDCVE